MGFCYTSYCGVPTAVTIGLASKCASEQTYSKMHKSHNIIL